jgi:hypothetical protein
MKRRLYMSIKKDKHSSMIRFINNCSSIMVSIDYIRGCNYIYQYRSFAAIVVLKEHKIDRKATTTKTKSHTRPSILTSLTITSCLLCDTHSMLWYETGTAMNARASENYLAIARSASKSVEIFWAEIYWGRL